MKKLLLLCVLLGSFTLAADEGMWPLNMLPKEQIEKKYGVTLDEAWVESVQKSCLRISLGGSGSFVSPSGLMVTNHHVGSKAIYHLSSEKQDLLKEGFYAASLEKERKCPNLFVDQLVSIEDVTSTIQQALSQEMTTCEREKARKTAITALCKKVQESTKLQPQVVSLYQGARYHLYLYKRYSDVRLVMAPEKAIAFFGGDEENFEFPRHCLDVCFFRVYENGQPLKTNHYFRWSRSGPGLQEPLFVAGHPGKTERLLTSSHLAFLRDYKVPFIVQLIEERIACLTRFQEISQEHKRRANQDMFSYQNMHKVYKAYFQGLKNGPIVQNKKAFEAIAFQEDSNLPLLQLQAGFEALKSYHAEFQLLEGVASRYCKSYGWAKHLVRVAEERPKPNEKRLREYSDSELAALELALFSEEPVYDNLEKLYLVDSLQRAVTLLGKEHQLVKLLLGSRSIEEQATFLINTTKLGDLAFRKRLYAHPEEIATCQDPLILLAKAIDPLARAMREKYENEHEGLEKESYDKVMQAMFAQRKETLCPDATFTLRLSIGQMLGYQEGQKTIEPVTTFQSAFASAFSHNSQVPFDLPEQWVQKQPLVNPKTPFNFVSTNDLIGGNSGSPIFNKNRELVGIVFDGNVQTLLWNYAYDDTQARAISVHSQAILESLSSIYNAKGLVNELQGIEK